MTNIGIIGTGTIASALVEGFCRAESDLNFLLSPRGAEKAAALAAAWPDKVRVCSSNQEVVDGADWVFLCVIPRLADEILSPLAFRPEQKILSIMSDHSIEEVSGWTGPVAKIIRMVPLPLAAMHIGPIAYTPADLEIHELFAPLGQLVELDTQEELSVISALTGVMSAFYHLIYDTSAWGAKQGLPARASLDYMTAFFEALCIKARAAKDGDVKALAYEMTPGGLNEMALKSLLAADGFKIWCDALTQVMDRLKKK